MWFGVRTLFWNDRGLPLCLDVDEKWGAEVKEAFAKTYNGPTTSFKGYTLGWFDQDILAGEGVVDQVWELLAPIVEATVAAGSRRITEEN